jgi:hypothetical protein
MLKTLHKNNTQITSFTVTKNWELSNTENNDVVLIDTTSSVDIPVGLEYIVYTPSYPITASNCDIALEQQTDDLVLYRDGLKTSGLFYPDTDQQNLDGTYKRMVYSQIYNTFYNLYRDPTKMWGLETLDFELSNTKKFISDQFTILDIPQKVFGEKIIPKTFVLYNTTTDNNYIMTDDGNCNLFAGTNLFSHQQEVGNFENNFVITSSTYCNYYDSITIPNQPRMSIIYNICYPPSVIISWNKNDWLVTNYIIETSTDGINYSQSFVLSGDYLSYTDTNINYNSSYWFRMYAENILGTSSYSSTSSIYTTYITWDIDSDYWDSNTCRNTTWDIE